MSFRHLNSANTHLCPQVGDLAYGRVNDVWRTVIIVDIAIGKRVRPSLLHSAVY